jgi:hypothetical protein
MTYEKVLGGGHILKYRKKYSRNVRLAYLEYPKLESLKNRFQLEDALLQYSKTELEQLELFIWAQTTFGNHEVVKLPETAKAIEVIIKEILGTEPIVDYGFRVVPEK